MVIAQVPQSTPGTATTVGHIIDPKTGNLIPVLVKPGAVTTNPSFVLPGTSPVTAKAPTISTAGPIHLPQFPGMGTSTSYTTSGNSITGVKTVNGAPQPSGCAFCDQMSPYLPLIVGGAVVLLLIWYFAGKK